MTYQRIRLPDTPMGAPGPLPPELVGLSDAVLANLSAYLPEASSELGYAGQGFIPVVRAIPALEFKQRIPASVRIAIRDAAAAGDKEIADFLDLLNTPGPGLIELDHPDTIAGVDYLLAHNLVTADQAAALRA